MPGGNGTGPAGAGPMTGRAAGFCAGNGLPGCKNPAGGRRGGGFGRQRGGRGGGCGRGFRNMFFATGLPRWTRVEGADAQAPNDKQMLRAQADALQSQLDAVRKRMEALE